MPQTDAEETGPFAPASCPGATSGDAAPEELYDQLPIVIELVREFVGDEHGAPSRCWLGAVRRPISWFVNGAEREVTHVVVTPRYAGGHIRPRVRNLTIGIAYVTDPSLMEDPQLGTAKCTFVAIALCHEASARGQGGRSSRIW